MEAVRMAGPLPLGRVEKRPRALGAFRPWRRLGSAVLLLALVLLAALFLFAPFLFAALLLVLLLLVAFLLVALFVFALVLGHIPSPSFPWRHASVQ